MLCRLLLYGVVEYRGEMNNKNLHSFHVNANSLYDYTYVVCMLEDKFKKIRMDYIHMYSFAAINDEKKVNFV